MTVVKEDISKNCLERDLDRLVNETRAYSETKAKTETRECETEIETETETKNLL